ncbi:MAG: hypothetical protein WCF12_07035 [Propionicimonas sp.]
MQNPYVAEQAIPTSQPTAQRRRRRRGPAARDQVVRCRLTPETHTRADQRASRAGLAVAAWLALLGLDVALRRPALDSNQLDGLRTDRDRLRLIGATVNSMAAAENRGRAVPDLQLAAALDRVRAAADRASACLADVERVFAVPADQTNPRPVAPTAPIELVAGRRQPTPAGERRDRVVFTRVTMRERDVLVRAAVADGLAVGGWLGQVAEAPEDERPALLGEQYAAVERVRRAARQLRTNLGQLDDARAARHAGQLPQLATATAAVDELLRHAWHVRGLIVAAAGHPGE